MLETFILAPLLINGGIISQEVHLSSFSDPDVDLVARALASDDVEDDIRFALTEPVSQRTKCYVSIFDLDFVRGTGRTVYSESSSPLTPVTKRKYFYYADQDVDKITSIVTLDNTIDSLLVVLEEMEEDAIKFGYSNVADVNNALLSYIRTINYSYSNHSSYFGIEQLGISANEIFCGDDYSSYIFRCESDVSHGITYNEYFKNFISSTLYNAVDHSNLIDGQVIHNWNRLSDPVGGNRGIDLLHMFFAIDGIYYNTGRNDFIINSFDLAGTEEDMTSWLGDLLQCCGYYKSNNGAYNALFNSFTFEFVLDDSYSGFGYEDYLADLDAYSITKGYLNYDYSVHDAIEAYYEALDVTGYSRETFFVEYYCSYGQNVNSCEYFCEAVQSYFGYRETDNGPTDTGSFYGNKSAFLVSDPFNSRNASLSLRHKVASLFIEYVIGRYNE